MIQMDASYATDEYSVRLQIKYAVDMIRFIIRKRANVSIVKALPIYKVLFVAQHLHIYHTQHLVSALALILAQKTTCIKLAFVVNH